MWLSRHLETIARHPAPIVFEGEAEWGAPHLIAALGETGRPLVWLELNPRDAGDPVVQGNKLAEAVERALGNPLFGYAMPYAYGLSVLQTYLDLLGPITLALSGAEHGPELAQKLLELHRGKNRVVLHFAAPAFVPSEEVLVLGPDELRLTLAEADFLAEGGLSKEELETRLEQSNGAYERFLALLRPGSLLTRPSPRGPRAVQGEAGLEPEALLAMLARQKRWIESLELVIGHFPERIGGVLEQAAQVMWARGTYILLAQMLARLPDTFQEDPKVLRWRLAAALELGQESELLSQVEAVLATREAPELRALYSLVLYRRGDLEGSVAQAKQAAETEKTPLTLYQYGWISAVNDPRQALSRLREALRFAELREAHYWVTSSALGMSQVLSMLGRYHEAVDWAEWALNVYQKERLGNMSLRLYLVNEWAFNRILFGDTTGLEDLLQPQVHYLENLSPRLALLLQSTLADLLVAEGRPGEALEVYAKLAEAGQRRERYGAVANLRVRVLLEQGRSEQALQEAERALYLTDGLPLLYRRRAELAYGMTLSLTRPAEAVQTLEPLLESFEEPLFAPRLAQTGLYLARAQLSLEDAAAAQATLARVRPALEQLGPSGFAYLAGPREAFREVWVLLQGHSFPLELEFLGASTVRLEGRELPFRRRYAEILTALALHPTGLNLEGLTLAVYGEATSPQTAKSDLSRLRSEGIPIETKPYRIAIPFRADFLEASDHLKAGKIREALQLYRGTLLKDSEAPAVVEYRELLEESLRQAVLSSHDPEAVWILAERMNDDLELWEATLETLPPNDPRRALAKARVERLGRDWGL